MKTLKIIFCLVIIQFATCPVFFTGMQTIKAQNIIADTVLANKHFKSAKEYFKKKSYDTAIVHFEKASVLYEKYEQWRKYLLMKELN